MLSDKKTACADMILTDAIEDMAEVKGIGIAEARDRIIASGAYECLYNFDYGLWMEGPDYFRCFVSQMEKRRNLPCHEN